MARSRHGTKILGLAVIVALGLMALSAAAAQKAWNAHAAKTAQSYYSGTN